MVSKPTGPRPPQQNRTKRRGPQPANQAPDIVDRPRDPQAGPSHPERGDRPDRPAAASAGRAAAGGATAAAMTERPTGGATGGGPTYSHSTLPAIALSGQVPAPKSSKGAKGGRGGKPQQPQTLPGYTSRIPDTNTSTPRRPSTGEELRMPTSPPRRSAAASGHSLQRGATGGATQGSRPSTNVTSNSVTVEVRKEQHQQANRRDQHPLPKERYTRQPHTLPGNISGAAPPGGSAGPHRESMPSSSKHTKDRHTRYVQHKQQAATLPPSGASGGHGVRTAHAHVHVPAHQQHPRNNSSNRPTPPRPTAAPDAATSASTNTAISPAQAQRSGSSRNPAEGRHPSASVTVTQGSRERDIARITVDARAIVNRQAAADSSNSNNLGVSLHPHNTDGTSSDSRRGPSSHHHASTGSNQFSVPHSHTGRRAPPPPNSTGAANNNGACVPNNAGRTVDPSNLRLDVVNAGGGSGEASGVGRPLTSGVAAASADHIQTNNLSAGISYGRPERPETTEALPDILNSHILPPYTVRQNQHRPSRQNQHQYRANGGGNGGSGNASRSRRRSRRRGGSGSAGMTQLDDEEKGCCSHEGCLRCVTVVTTFRWVLVSLALLGVLCVITGIVLGALHMTVGSSFLTLSLMFIGLGVMLVIVVGVGWKCTPQGHEPCHLLFNLGDHCTRDVRATSHRRHRDRNHWYGGVTYPEFRYRRPPPSYSASMQEFQQQLMLAQLQLNNDAAVLPPGGPGLLPPSGSDDNYSLPSSPPPSYKSRASTIRPGLHITFPPQGASYPSSQPPTYRSRAGGADRPSLNLEATEGGVDNPACSDADAPWSSSSASSATSSAFTSPLTSSRASPARSLPDSATSTMHRADQVVGYLDDVLQDHDRTLDHSVAAAAAARGRADTVVETGTGTEKKGKVPVAGGVTPGASLNSVRTSASIEETNRIQDTQL